MIRRLLEAALIPSSRAAAAAASLDTLAAYFRRAAESHRNLVVSEAALRREVEQHRETNRQRAVDEARALSCGHTRFSGWFLRDATGRQFWGCLRCEYDRRGSALRQIAADVPAWAEFATDALKGRDVE